MYDSPNVDSPHIVVRERLRLVPERLRGLVNSLLGVALLCLDIAKGRRPRRETILTELYAALPGRVPERHRTLYGTLVMCASVWRYRVPRLEVPTILVHTGRRNAAEIGLTGDWTDGMMGWSEHVSDRFQHHLVDADHNEVPYHPRAVELLREALGGRPGGG